MRQMRHTTVIGTCSGHGGARRGLARRRVDTAQVPPHAHYRPYLSRARLVLRPTPVLPRPGCLSLGRGARADSTAPDMPQMTPHRASAPRTVTSCRSNLSPKMTGSATLPTKELKDPFKKNACGGGRGSTSTSMYAGWTLIVIIDVTRAWKPAGTRGTRLRIQDRVRTWS